MSKVRERCRDTLYATLSPLAKIVFYSNKLAFPTKYITIRYGGIRHNDFVSERVLIRDRYSIRVFIYDFQSVEQFLMSLCNL